LRESDRAPRLGPPPSARSDVANSIVRCKVVERTKAIVDGCGLSARSGFFFDGGGLPARQRMQVLSRGIQTDATFCDKRYDRGTAGAGACEFGDRCAVA
jgi:hypothetical protein